MKYWRGYLVAAIIGFFTWALLAYAQTHSALIDMVYPYVSRMIQSFLADWSSTVAVCVWQIAAIVLVALALAGIVLMIILRWNPIQLLGWFLAVASLIFFIHVGMYGLNGYAGPIAEDMRLNVTEYNIQELEDATAYYRDKANELSHKVNRDGAGNPLYPEFATLAEQAAEGFDNLVYQQGYSIFAGSTVPVKELGWADMYTSMGITGFTMSITGEAAVNPQTPVVGMPFTMCHEMAHRMCIQNERDANFSAYLACEANTTPEFQYSGYFMAYRYCYAALAKLDAEAAGRVRAGLDSLVAQDLAAYQSFFAEKEDPDAREVADTINNGYINISGDDRGIDSYGDVVQLLVSWHIQEVILPQQIPDVKPEFDPYDVDLNATAPTEAVNG